MKYVAPSAPLSVGGVLDNWLRLFRSSFAACWPIALLATIAGALVQFAITPRMPQYHAGVPLLQYYVQYFSAVRGPMVLLADIFFWFISLLVYGGILTQQAALVRGEEPFSFGTALTKGLSRVPQLFLGWVLIVLIVAAICAPIGIGAAVMIPFHPAGGTIFVGALAAVALLILLIYVTVRLQVWMAAMFSENLGATSSLGRSWALVKGHWWRVTGIGFVAGIVMWIVTGAIGALIGIVIAAMGVHGATPDLMVRRIQLIGTVSQVARLLTMPLLTAVWFAIYQDLKLRREGGDLAARAEALSGK
jgi:hypothetical protein